MTAVHKYEKMIQEDLNVGTDVGTKTNPAGGSMVGTQIGVHSLAVGQVAVSAVWDPGVIASLGVESTTVTVQGAALGDFVMHSFSLTLGGLWMFAEVTSANTVTVSLFNPTTASINLESGTIRVLVLKSR